MRTIPLEQLTDEDLARHRTIAMDVDGTLILWSGPTPGSPGSGEPKPNVALIERMMRWKALGDRDWIVWSGNGKEHAWRMVAGLGLQAHVHIVSAKPTLMLDDAPGWFDDNCCMVEVH